MKLCCGRKTVRSMRDDWEGYYKWPDRQCKITEGCYYGKRESYSSFKNDLKFLR